MAFPIQLLLSTVARWLLSSLHLNKLIIMCTCMMQPFCNQIVQCSGYSQTNSPHLYSGYTIVKLQVLYSYMHGWTF